MEKKLFKGANRGWDIEAWETKKGIMVEMQGPYGWQKYYIPNPDKLPLTATMIRLSIHKGERGVEYKSFGMIKRGEKQTIKDAFGNPVKIWR